MPQDPSHGNARGPLRAGPLKRYWRSLSPALQRYYRASAVPSVLFVGLIALHEWASHRPDLAPQWRIAFALAPIVALAWMYAGYLRFLRDCDELERRIESVSLAWAAGIALHAVMACLFAMDAGLIGWPADRAVAYIGLLLIGSYALIRAALHRRYR